MRRRGGEVQPVTVTRDRRRGVVLAMVLILGLLLSTAVVSFLPNKPPVVMVSSTGSFSRSGSSNILRPSMRRVVYVSSRRPLVLLSTDTSNHS